MDSFELVRINAEQLHRELVDSGVDPAKPIALIEAACQKLDIELNWLNPANSALKGGRALFDEQTGTICCANDGSDGERALLAAHEIGHARMHGSTTQCDVTDIDPSRSVESAPVGLQKVEDYGASERRELQANVFAREFLFPRLMARRMHLDEQLGARVIAGKLGLPLDLVRQQIFDAVLLPAIPVEPQIVNPAATNIDLDDSQRKAAEHRGTAFLLQAGPGTGKTKTLIGRVLSLIKDGADPASILVVTFSNRAAGELMERLTDALPNVAQQIWTGTFHAFGLDLIRRHYDLLDLPSDPMLFDRSDAIEVLEEILPTLRLKHYRNLWDPEMELREIIGAISRAKDELVGPERYRELGEAMLKSATDDEAQIAAQKCLEVADIYALYERELRSRRAVDFGDLIMRPALLLERNDKLRAAIQLRHRHVLVDEFQDVNRASSRLLRAVAGDGRRLWVVGDSRQSIYRFRGASSANMALFSAEYPQAATGQLEKNYRSSSEVVDLFVGFSRNMTASEGMLPLSLRANRGRTSTRPEVRTLETLEEEAEGIAASVRELERAGVPLRDQAVLCRSNARLNEVANALEVRGIPVLHLGSLFERDEIRDLLALMSLAVDPFGGGLVRIATLSRYGLSLQDVSVATKFLRERKRPALDGLLEAANDSEVSPKGAESLRRLQADLEGFSAGMTPWDYLATWLLDRTRHVAELATVGSIASQMRGVAIWQFLNFVRDRGPIVSGAPIQRLLSRIRQLVLLAEERDLRQVPAGALHMNAVRLMTVHGSKGLEFEAVHIPGLTVTSFPSSNRGQRCPPPDGMITGTAGLTSTEEHERAHAQEEECLFFVAASRACTHLRTYLYRKQSNGKNRSASPFVALIRSHASEVANPGRISLPPDAPRPQPIQITWSADWETSDHRLRSYEKCPRRFFYTHVLGLGGARKPTAFSRTEDCIYEVIGWLASQRLSGDPSEVDALTELNRVWDQRGPADHAFANDYRKLAIKLVQSLVASGAGRRFRESQPLAINFANGEVVIEPDELAELPDGTVVIRRVRTGRKRKTEYDELGYTLYHVAAQKHFGNSYSFEAVHLADGLVEPVVVTAAKMKNRQEKGNEYLAGIAAGQFPPEIDAISCPRCPHFFICAATPEGPVTST